MTALARLADTPSDLARMPAHMLGKITLTQGATYNTNVDAFFPRHLRGVEESCYGASSKLTLWQEFDIFDAKSGTHA